MKRFPPMRGRTWRGATTGSTRAWRTQRARVIMRDGGRCTHIDQYGARCPARSPLEVHHLVPGHGPTALDSQLITVCRKHHPR